MLIGSTDQCYPIEIDGFPIMPVDSEIETLITASVEDHESASVLAHLNDPIPHLVSDSCRDLPTEHSWRYLQEPACQMPPQASGAGSENHDYHIRSFS